MDARLREAAQTGSIDVLYQLIKEDPCALERIDSIPFLDTPLHVAACAGRVDFMMEMMNLKPSFARRLNQDGSSPMHLALRNNRTQALLRLLKFDEGLVRVKGREGLTPLHHAVQTGEVDLLIKFLEACPEAIEDVSVRDETVFHLAAKNDMFDAFQVLVGWLVRSRHEAAQRWEKELLSWADIEGNTVLHIAATKNSSQMVKLLLEHMCGDHVNAKNLEGLTALDMLRKLHGDAIEDMVRKAGGLSGSLIPNKSISSVDIKSLRKKMTRFQKISTILSRGRKGISNEMRSTFLVVTVLIITATYQASLTPPDKSDDNSSPSLTSVVETLSVPSDAPTPSGAPTGNQFLLRKLDVFNMFWLYNTLTFWAAICLTAYLLPSRSICLFLLITLSLFGTCYLLLATYSSWSLRFLNYCLSTILALLVLFRIARYIRRRFVPRKKIFILVNIISICFFAVMLVPAVLFSESKLDFPYFSSDRSIEW
ncbi:hypothetical protein V6N13_121836 [Hibiscus sabdariffa]|uniref:PGG domain-containing protein n=1 Tax=Hibiscus sabdariffa TaxID=183260 RepID=A0ABR2C6V2_9ROSI